MKLLFSQPLALVALALVPALVWIGLQTLPHTRRSYLIIALRALAMTSLVLALAGIAVGLPKRDLSVVFLVDSSDSLGADTREAAREWVRRAYAEAGGTDKAGVVLFGKEPLVEQDVRAVQELGHLLSQPDGTATDIGAALRLALAMFPEGSQKRIVLLSDGNDNAGDLREAAELAAAAGVQVQTHLLGTRRESDVLVEAVQAPPRVRQGESFEIEVAVRSTDARSGTLEVLGDGQVLTTRPVNLQAGVNRYTVEVGEQPKGFRRWQARVLAAGDTVSQNNEGNAFTYVESPPRVLVAEGERGEGVNLTAALNATGLQTTLIAASALPRDLTELSEYASVVLVDVPLSAIPDRGALLQTYVRDLGRGLVTVGGEDSYALGDYFDSPLEAALPVDSRIKNRQEDPAVAMVMAIDKSGSMAASHSGEAGGEIPKVEVAKAAAVQSAELLSPDDEFGVVAFDTAARWVIRPAPLTENSDVGNKVADIQGSGGTNIYGGLAEAIESLKASKASIKHVILLTDGWSNVGNYDQLLAEAREAGITVSTISAQGGSPELLSSIAEKGNGKFYIADDNRKIPEIVVKETRTRVRRYIQEAEFFPAITAPSPVLKNLTEVPSLLGYVSTTPKPTASVALSSNEQDPVLAQWQHGLGRSVSWTSDAESRWSRNWIGTPEYARLWSQAVGWTLARPSENVQVQVSQSGGEAEIEVDALRPDGTYLNGARAQAGVVAPDGKVTEIPLTQTAPGRYEASVAATSPGTYITSVSVADEGQLLQAPTTGFAVGYSPEYLALGPNTANLNRVASLTGGREIAEPREVWANNMPAVLSNLPLSWPLMLLALLLLPLEVAVRRLKFTRQPAPAVRLAASAPTSPHHTREATQARHAITTPQALEMDDGPSEAEAAPQATPVEPDRMERLRNAKRRAGRQ